MNKVERLFRAVALAVFAVTFSVMPAKAYGIEKEECAAGVVKNGILYCSELASDEASNDEDQAEELTYASNNFAGPVYTPPPPPPPSGSIKLKTVNRTAD